MCFKFPTNLIISRSHETSSNSYSMLSPRRVQSITGSSPQTLDACDETGSFTVPDSGVGIQRSWPSSNWLWVPKCPGVRYSAKLILSQDQIRPTFKWLKIGLSAVVLFFCLLIFSFSLKTGHVWQGMRQDMIEPSARSGPSRLGLPRGKLWNFSFSTHDEIWKFWIHICNQRPLITKDL